MSSLTLEGCFQHNWKQADISRYHLLETYKKTHPDLFFVVFPYMPGDDFLMFF